MNSLSSALISLISIILVYLIFFAGVDRKLRAVAPKLTDALPWPVWIILIGGTIGALIRRLDTMEGFEITSFTMVISSLRNLFIIGALFIIASLQASEFRTRIKCIGAMLLPSFVGAIGVALGALLTGWIIYYLTGDTNEIQWGKIRHWVVANVNGWTGDSSTQFPLFAFLEEMSPQSKKTQLAASTVVIPIESTLFTIWFTFVAFLVRGFSKSREKKNETQGSQSKSLLPTPHFSVICTSILAAAALALAPEGIRESKYWHLIVITLFILIAIFGFRLGISNSRKIGTRTDANKFLALGLACFSLSTGVKLADFSFYQEQASLLVFIGCSLGALAGNFLLLCIFRLKYNASFLAVTAVCSVGGLASAPVVAEEYSQKHHDGAHIVDGSYFCALFCNIMSIPLCMIVWQLLP